MKYVFYFAAFNDSVNENAICENFDMQSKISATKIIIMTTTIAIMVVLPGMIIYKW